MQLSCWLEDSSPPNFRINGNNVRAFCPPPMPSADDLSLGQGWQTDQPTWNYRATRLCASQSGRAAGPDIANSPHVDFDIPPSTFTGSLLSSAYAQPIMPVNALASGYSPAFREKTLSEAHQLYVDLLTDASVRRANLAKRENRKPGSHRGFVYPKPPNPIGLSANGTPKKEGPDDGRRNASEALPKTGQLYNRPQPLAASRNFIPKGSFESTPQSAAKFNLEILSALCEQNNWQWQEGMLMGGCLHYGLGNFEDALQWYSHILVTNPRHVVAMTNAAAASYCLGRYDDAEQYWSRSMTMCPEYLEATEHLVGLLYRKRSREAIEAITYVQESLRLGRGRPSSWTGPGNSLLGAGSGGYGSSGYSIPGSENGRMLALLHAKGTMLYGMQEIGRAAEAFEEAVLISTGQRASNVQELVRRIQQVLSPPGKHGELSTSQPPPLLLGPAEARKTAQILFGGRGELPGLAHVIDEGSRWAASQTTSNSLLSLAKIFQDSMANDTQRKSPDSRIFSVGDILSLYYLSLSLQESPSTANNVGILLAGVQSSGWRHQLSQDAQETMRSTKIPGILPGSGLALALAYYQYGLRLDPKHVHLHTNLGSLLKDIGQLDLAIQMYQQAVACDGNFDIALTNLANAVKDRGRIKDAITYYRRAVQANPTFSEAVCGLLTALNSVCDWKGRGGVFLDFGRFDRWHVDDSGALVDARSRGRGSGVTQRVVNIVAHQLEEASHWGKHTLREDMIWSMSTYLAQLCQNQGEQLAAWLRAWKGQSWEGCRLVRLVERATRVAVRNSYLAQIEFGTSPPADLRMPLPPGLTVPSAPTILPFHTFTCPLSAKDVRAISQRNAHRTSCLTLKSSWLPASLPRPPTPPAHHLNVGYISSDFNNHPLAHLMQSVFGFHDTRRVRAHCYATSPSDKSLYRQKIEKEAPVFRDVSDWASASVVRQILEDNIHILVNLNGYTRGARNDIFAARPAPIQMSFMGFAGTLGAEWCDYILADHITVPPGTLRPWRNNLSIDDLFQDRNEEDDGDWVYSENVVYCKETFFCCDHAQSSEPGEREVSWATEQERRWQMRKSLFPSLPDEAIILGNFNQLYKIEPTTFRTWLRILAGVPRAVLWLLRFPDLGEANLLETAKAWAGDEVTSRLIFTDVAPKNQHIARARVCDLFLDTPECNAHTTAADVLWSSTPLLTLPRYPYKMCSRMAASILKGALPRSAEGERIAATLIANTETEYEQTAIALGNGLTYHFENGLYGEGRGPLMDMRRILFESKWACPLFDTRRWVSNVESAYEVAWRRWVDGQGGDIFL
ncbi:glycosyl transferase family 41-domain-containing protein [Emericellopsis atlantica]|uniref:protein O-GlcNAc transferase n=1 Tax=Emericellopsis atlantica TaxID=2614577 RepID=A0A9P7ZPZ3_9HYPO|nr:glycosyl transferase family 41-domain-containing protein [Emericellopsis atlantica]KAG9256163.1 glycosyl transferase family 41-domain-containing protein [Emericellopsis atlantica]